MRILIVPLPALAPTQGSQSRMRLLCAGFQQAGFEVATCAALDLNYQAQPGIRNYYLEVPIPLGLPAWLGKNLFQIASRTGLNQRKEVHSFEEVLFLTGTLSEAYFEKSIQDIRRAVQQYQPDIVYSEFNLSAIAAARLEKVKCITDFSYPVQAAYACSPKYAAGVKRVLYKLGLPEVATSLEIFDWADYKVVPSCYELEPVKGENVIFTGPFRRTAAPSERKTAKNKIVAYMGSGTISSSRLVRTLKQAFYKTHYEVYIAGASTVRKQDENIFCGPQFDFGELLPEAAVMIHHGGQNSMMDALCFGVPQLICPGKVFERKYNAQSVEKRGAAIVLSEKAFDAQHIRQAVTRLTEEDSYREMSHQLWQSLSQLGGVDTVIQWLKRNHES